jgi:hypothetical protein
VETPLTVASNQNPFLMFGKSVVIFRFASEIWLQITNTSL